MKLRYLSVLTLCMLILTAAAGASQTVPDSAQYGKVLFCDDFESYENGTDVITNSAPVAFMSNAFTTKFGTARYGTAGYVHSVQTVNGSKQLKIAKKSASQRWPQFMLNLSKPLENGIYTLAYTVTLPDDSAGVNSANTRLNIKDVYGTTSSSDKGVALTKGGTKMHAVTLKVGNNSIGSRYAAIQSFLVFASCDETTEGSYILLDDLVLYGKTDQVAYTLPDGTVRYDFFNAGDSITLASARDFAAFIEAGKTAVCLRKDGVDYPFGGTYQTTSGETSAAFDVICADRIYTVYFDADTRCATLPETAVTDGVTVTLPALDKEDFLCWELPDKTVKSPGDTFVFDVSAFCDKFDSDGRLVIKAVYESEKTLYAPQVPADLSSGSGSVTVGALLQAALAVKDSVYAENSVYPADKEAFISYAVSVGLLDEAKSYDAPATTADAVRVLANTLPSRFYPTLTGDAFGASVTDSLRPYVDKLYRAGILADTDDLSETLTKDGLTALVSKLCDKSLRSVSAKRTIYVFGDSLCDPSASYNSWIEKLRNYLDGNIDIVNYAVGGYNTGSYVRENAGGYAKYTEMLSKVKKGDYVFVALGTNDATLWLWNDYPNLSDQGQKKLYVASRDDYETYSADARAAGAVPVYIVPVGRNIDKIAASSPQWEYDARIASCMRYTNTYYDTYTPIINFKTVSDPLINEQMTAEERAAFYRDSVHYTDSGADLTAQMFRDIVSDDDNAELTALRTHLSDGFDLSADTGDNAVDLQIDLTQRGSITVQNVSEKPKKLSLIFAVKNADGRLTGVQVENERLLGVGDGVSFTAVDDNDTGLTIDPALAESQTPYGTLYVFGNGMSPVLEPIPVYLTSKDIAFDIGDLMREV